jgi:hypothetical protein
MTGRNRRTPHPEGPADGAGAGHLNEALRSLRLDMLLTETEPVDRNASGQRGGLFGAIRARDLASAMWSLGPARSQRDIATVTDAVDLADPEPGRCGAPSTSYRRRTPVDADPDGCETAGRGCPPRCVPGPVEADAELACEVLGEALSGSRMLTRAQC